MFRKPLNVIKVLAVFLVLLFLLIIGVTAVNLYVRSFSKDLIYSDVKAVPQKQAILVLGAKVYSNGGLSSMLYDRAETAIDLYNQGKATRILVSGDHGRDDYDEVNTIKNYLLSKGIPAKVIFMDHAGFDTYDSMYRARDVFEVKSVIIVTQEFHLPRAIYVSRSLGLDTVGVVADKQPYAGIIYNQSREIIANIKAYVDVTLKVSPKFLGPKIPITGDSKKSWD